MKRYLLGAFISLCLHNACLLAMENRTSVTTNSSLITLEIPNCKPLQVPETTARFCYAFANDLDKTKTKVITTKDLPMPLLAEYNAHNDTCILIRISKDTYHRIAQFIWRIHSLMPNDETKGITNLLK